MSEIKKIDVTIESTGERYLDIITQDNKKMSLTLPYDLVEQFLKNLEVSTDYIDNRNQKAWESIQKIRQLDTINFGTISECLKDIPSLEIKEVSEEVPKKKRKVKLIRDLNLPDEYGMKKDNIFSTNTSSKEVACVKASNGKFVTLQSKDFIEVESDED